MKVLSAYPPYAVKCGCFNTHSYELAPGVRILCLDIDTEFLPPFGMLCLSQQAIELLVHEMGWELVTQEFEDNHDQLRTENILLKERVAVLTRSLMDIVVLEQLKRAADVLDRRLNASIDEAKAWANTLEPVSR